MSNWRSLKEKEQIELFNNIASKTGLPSYAIEKDAWVTLVLRILFNSEIASQIVFKGGTSLSKAYNLINRFSEDIDFAIDRVYLGFAGELTKGQIRKLRRASHQFASDQLPVILSKEFSEYGVPDKSFEIEVPNIKISDQDPETVFVNYQSVFENESYLPSKVLIEIGARSLIEPYESRTIKSFIDNHYSEADFGEKPFEVRTVVPQKTFLEKMILLDEEFKKAPEKIRHHRMSRHLYDIMRIMETDYGKQAIKDEELFRKICDHREIFTPVPTVNYKELTLKNLSFIPPDELIELYRKDYSEMQSSMIYGESPKFDELIEKLKSYNK